MTVLRAVLVRSAEPFDEEESEGLAHAFGDLRLRLVHAMEGDELRLVGVHVIVEASRQRARSFETETIERCVIGTETSHGQWRFDFGNSDFSVEQYSSVFFFTSTSGISSGVVFSPRVFVHAVASEHSSAP